MKIATWNVNSIAARLPLVVRWLETARPEIVCLQEIKCTDERFPHAAFNQLGYTAETYGQRTYNGVAILSLAPLYNVARGFGEASENGEEEEEAAANEERNTSDESSHELKDEIELSDKSNAGFSDAQARLLAATIRAEKLNQDVRVIDVYVPNGASVGSDKYVYKLEWLRRLNLFIEANYGRDEAVVMCGDFNIAPDDRDVYDPQAWRGSVLVSEAERNAFEELKEWGLSDAFRLLHNDGNHFSWWDYRGGDFRRNAGLRIDHLLISDALAARLKQVWIDTEPRTWERPSDHTPVIAEFE